MTKDLEGYECEEQDDGSLICRAETKEGVCEIVEVPDGHGGWKMKRQSGDPETCESLEEVVIEQKT